MKKLLYTLFVLVGMSTVSFAQSVENTAIAQSKAELVEAKVSGIYTFGIPGDKTSEEIADRAKFYTNYFTVSFDEVTDVATVNMVDNTPENRTIISRFLLAAGCRTAKVGEKQIPIVDFAMNYLK